MDEIEDRLELGSAIKAGPALLFGAHHAAPGRFQGSDLRIEVLLNGRCARVSDFGLISVHFGCAFDMVCSLSRNIPKVNTKVLCFRVHAHFHFGYTQFDTLSRPAAMDLASAVDARLPWVITHTGDTARRTGHHQKIGISHQTYPCGRIYPTQSHRCPFYNENKQ